MLHFSSNDSSSSKIKSLCDRRNNNACEISLSKYLRKNIKTCPLPNEKQTNSADNDDIRASQRHIPMDRETDKQLFARSFHTKARKYFCNAKRAPTRGTMTKLTKVSQEATIKKIWKALARASPVSHSREYDKALYFARISSRAYRVVKITLWARTVSNLRYALVSSLPLLTHSMLKSQQRSFDLKWESLASLKGKAAAIKIFWSDLKYLPMSAKLFIRILSVSSLKKINKKHETIFLNARG